MTYSADYIEEADGRSFFGREEHLLLAEMRADEGVPTPHWDDAICGDTHIDFVWALPACGVLTLCFEAKNQQGLFFVTKESGRLRFMVGAKETKSFLPFLL